MVYFDTSFLVPMVVPEANSRQIVTVMQELDAARLAISHWVQVEFCSMIAQSVRTGRLEASGALRANAEFEELVERSFTILLPTQADFQLASRFLLRFDTKLRAGDALHLAIASNQRARAIYSLDRTMVSAGAKLGLPTMGLPVN
jgi:predicted nucleic acid-binding protein